MTLADESDPSARLAPRVVLFRANSIDVDSRAKKISLSLARLGYDVHVLSAEDIGAPTELRHLGPVTVHPVIITRSQRDAQLHKLAARRRRQLRVIDWTPQDEYVTQVRELRKELRGVRRHVAELRGRAAPTDEDLTPDPAARESSGGAMSQAELVYWVGRYAMTRAKISGRKARWSTQIALNAAHREAWRKWDEARQGTEFLATTRGMMPEIEDYATSFSRVLDNLRPDIIHAHHPAVLGTAMRAARRQRAMGRACYVVYDAREDFQGLPKQEQGHWRRHSVLVREEARYIRAVDGVMSVSEPITSTLQSRYHLPNRPSLVYNVPIDDPAIRPGAVSGPTVRDVIGLAPEVPLLVYSGAVSRARGVDLLVEAMEHMPGVHVVVVPVPFPHPHQGDLVARATAIGAQDRLHFAPPVDQDRLLHYLSGADIGVLPFRTGSANIEHALPNKLFEYLHAGLRMVASDARLITDFISNYRLGEVFAGGDAVDLAAAVTKALGQPPLAQEPEWEPLRRQYSWQHQEPAIRELYAGLIPPPNPKGIDEGIPFGSLSVQPGPPEGFADEEPAVAVERRRRRTDPPLPVEEPLGPDNPADAVEPVQE